MKKILSLITASLTLSLTSVHTPRPVDAVPSQAANAPFSFALIGDLPYGDTQVAQFENVIAEINNDNKIRFVIHDGDVKAGGETCDNDRIQARFNQFQKFEMAFIITPGDNDWTDCHRTNNGSYYPPERLDYFRTVFYPRPNLSTGQRPIPVVSQAATSGFEKYVENVRFVRNNIVFATVHVVGSNNNLAPWTGYDPNDSTTNPRPDRIAEFEERQAASLNWINQTFDQAEATGAAGVFIAIQANPRFELDPSSPDRAGFNAFLDQLRTRAKQYGKPTVLAHGDFHEYIVDKPLDTDANPGVPKFTRIQSIGSPRVYWVKVQVDPKSSPVFTFEEKIVDANIPQ
jgi:hypothetical protein